MYDSPVDKFIIPGLYSYESSPESIMWNSCLIRLLLDLEAARNLILENRKLTKCSITPKAKINTLEYELNHYWCEVLCDFAGINHGVFKKAFYKVRDNEINVKDFIGARRGETRCKNRGAEYF